MARLSRLRISSDDGSYHIICRVIGRKGQNFLIDREGKDYLLALLRLCCSAYFVKLHSFCILDNHFHLLISEDEDSAQRASDTELEQRYYQLKGKDYLALYSSELLSKEVLLSRLRSRFSDVSRFMQDLKQGFSVWYNKKHNRLGTLWTDRFKSILVSKGKAQLDVSAYIDLNAVRAGIVSSPDQYKWCSLGYIASGCDSQFVEPVDSISEENDLSFKQYKSYVYDVGDIKEHATNSQFSENESSDAEYFARTRVPTFSSGIVVGSAHLVERVQKILSRKVIKARKLFDGVIEELFSTRIYRHYQLE